MLIADTFFSLKSLLLFTNIYLKLVLEIEYASRFKFNSHSIDCNDVNYSLNSQQWLLH